MVDDGNHTKMYCYAVTLYELERGWTSHELQEWLSVKFTLERLFKKSHTHTMVDYQEIKVYSVP